MKNSKTEGEMNSLNFPIYDCIGIGFGPSNIALAIALEERDLLKKSLFLEARNATLWQPGMLIEGTDIQHNPLRDFVTPRNPCSPYGFLSYLNDMGRLFDYLNLSAPFPPRTEYAKYVSWVAEHFLKHVEFDTVANNIEYLSNDEGELIKIKTSKGLDYYTKSLVIASGRSRHVPPEFRHLLNEDVIHSDNYLQSKKKWLTSQKKPTVAVIGGSQSAVEIILDLWGDCHLVGISRSFGFKQKDLSPFTEYIYYPDYVDYFYNSDVGEQNSITKELWRSNYSAADHDVLNLLNFRLYEQKVMGEKEVQLFHNSIIKKIDSPSGSKKSYHIHFSDRYSGVSRTAEVDGVIFATGYKNFGSDEKQEHYHPLLKNIVDNLVFRADGGPDVLRSYLLNTKEESAPVYLNGLCESSHGFGDAGSFSLLSVRSDVIASSLQETLQKV